MPKTHRPQTKCRRKACSRAWRDHPGGLCPDGKGAFLDHKHPQQSTSFTDREVVLMAKTLQGVLRGLRGRDMGFAMRAAEFPSICRKWVKMRERSAAKAQRTRNEALFQGAGDEESAATRTDLQGLDPHEA